MQRLLARLRGALLFLLGVACTLYPDINVTLGKASGKYVLRGTLVTPDEVIANGELVIQGGVIECAEKTCSAPAGAAVLTITDAYIFPGFVDAHNHVAYNFLPKWKPPRQDYQHRDEWLKDEKYKKHVAPYQALGEAKETQCLMTKYGEIKALLSGVTTIQGTRWGGPCVKMLIRNAENQSELGIAPLHIRTDALGRFPRVDFSKTKTRSFVPHVAEGTNDKARKEFDTLKTNGLLRAETAIIHGTAFREPQFEEMGKVGAKLIWSPQSNLALYGETTNIKLARQHKVEVSLGVDWNLTGSDNIFDELRVGAKVNQEKFDNAIPDGDWVKMITVNPARALALEKHVGRLAKGLKADLVVLRSRDANPSLSLLANHLPDVELVWVGGDPLYGDASAVQKLKPGACEELQVAGSSKRVCVKKDTKGKVPNSTQTLKQIQTALKKVYPGLAPLAP